ncbi:hypothetical protein GPROT1_02371 [Gammaproteobacteria bacterium]|nr:hypothetical protein GPROT1_02371 [Gammaproteobacteria bacterium]
MYNPNPPEVSFNFTCGWMIRSEPGTADNQCLLQIHSSLNALSLFHQNYPENVKISRQIGMAIAKSYLGDGHRSLNIPSRFGIVSL